MEFLIDLMRDSSDLVLRYGLNFALALTLIVGGFMFGRWAQRTTISRLSSSTSLDPTLIPLFGRVVRMMILGLVTIAALAQFGVQTTSIITLIGAGGIAIALALRDTLSNVASGLLLLVVRPFGIGDVVNLSGGSGTVQEITLFLVKLRTPEGFLISIPNAEVAANAMTNLTRFETRRMDIPVGVSYQSDLAQARAVIAQVIAADSRLLTEPGPEVFVESLGDSSVNLMVRAHAKHADYWPARHALLQSIKEALDAHNVEIPFPRRELSLRADDVQLLRSLFEAKADVKSDVKS